MSKKRILVIDDQQSILQMVKVILESEGYEVECSEDEKCLEQFDGNCPDLILLDVLLQNNNGYEVAKAFRKSYTEKNVPIILVSAHFDLSVHKNEGVFNDFLAKPFHIDDLISKVALHIQN